MSADAELERLARDDPWFPVFVGSASAVVFLVYLRSLLTMATTPKPKTEE